MLSLTDTLIFAVLVVNGLAVPGGVFALDTQSANLAIQFAKGIVSGFLSLGQVQPKNKNREPPQEPTRFHFEFRF